MPVNNPTILPYGDGAFLIRFPNETYSRKVCDRVQDLAALFQANGYWDEVVCGYNSLLLAFNPSHFNSQTARKRIEDKVLRLSKSSPIKGKTVDIPVVYGGEFGPDMSNIMASSGLSEADIIAAHSGATYRVCMMGFIPGFAFLSEAPKSLHHPRHAEPRLSVPAGSVGIAGWQTGIYGLESPGGWQIIGRTSLRMFDKDREAPFLLSAGDTIRFVPAAKGDFDD